MESLLNKLIENRKLYLLPIFVAGLTVYLIKDYFTPGVQIILGLLIAPFVFKVNKHNYSYRYAIASVIFIVAYYFLNAYIFLFFSVGCLLLFTIECQWGKIGILPFLFLGCISPAMHYIINTFTFSIRLTLSNYAAKILNTFGMAVENKGSYFILPDASSFSVDTACIGLNMFNTGLSVTLLLIGFAEQKTNKKFSWIHLFLIFSVCFFCLILTNLFRIVGLVLFKSEPGTFLHDGIGIASFIVYTLVPVYFFIKLMQKTIKQTITVSGPVVLPAFKKNLFITFSLSILLCISSFKVKDQLKHSVKDEKLNALTLAGYTKKTKEDGVAEFRKDETLIYIKPAVQGYQSDHPPSICWQGSGFELEKIAEEIIGNYKILSALLKRGNIVYYTAWWYDNGKHKTINQWDWRFSKGEPYRIINITTKSKKELNEVCSFYLKEKLF